MKQTILILITTLIIGCVSTQEKPSILLEDIPGCPDIINLTAENLVEIGVEQTVTKRWKDYVFSKEIQPCNACNRLNEAILIIRDEKNIYRPAMTRLINAVEKIDMVTKEPSDQQMKMVSRDLEGNNNKDTSALAGRYVDALEVLEVFLVSELGFVPDDAKNFILDNFFIPLMVQQEESQDEE